MASLIVKPIEGIGTSSKKPMGYELFPDLKANIYISAGTNSGKTTLINHILTYCIDKHTIVHLYVAPAEIDPTYRHIIRNFNNRGIKYSIYMHIIDVDGNEVLNDLVYELSKVKPVEEAPKDKPVIIGKKIVNGAIITIYAKPDKKADVKPLDKNPNNSPDHLFLFDDLAQDMRHKHIYNLMAKQRHFTAKTIIATQSIKDIYPKCIPQLSYLIIFGGHSMKTLEDLYKTLQPYGSFEEFINYYRTATSEKYHFLYYDRNRAIYKKDFTTVLFAK